MNRNQVPPSTGWPADVPRPRPPVWSIFDVQVDVRPTGEVVADLDIDAALTAGRGLASAGLVALLTDCVLGTDAALRARTGIATVALTIDFVARPPVTGLLHAVSGTHGRRSDHLLTTATVRDGDGTDVAVASGWFALRGARPAGPHPSVPPGDMPRRKGVAALDEPAAATAPTDPCTTPLGRTLGLTGFTRTPDGDVTLELAEVGPLRNSGGTLHGGVAALISSLAALATRDESAARAVVLSMNCHYLRPAGSGGGPVRVTGRQIRRGRTSAVVRGDVHAPDGRLAMYTVLTTALEP